MDMVRSGKLSTMQFTQGSNALTPVAWYRCSKDARFFPGVHAFLNSDNDPPEKYTGVGDYNYTPRLYSKGKNPGMTGQQFCGPLSYFQQGIPAEDDPTPLEVDANGIPTCCPPDIEALDIGGTAPVTFIPGPTCVECVPGCCVPYTLNAVISGTGCSSLDGVPFQFVYDEIAQACAWRAALTDPDGQTIALTMTGFVGLTWQLAIVDQPGGLMGTTNQNVYTCSPFSITFSNTFSISWHCYATPWTLTITE